VLYTVFIVNPNVSSELKHDAALASPGLDSKELAKFLDVALHLEGDAPQMPVAHSHFVFWSRAHQGVTDTFVSNCCRKLVHRSSAATLGSGWGDVPRS